MKRMIVCSWAALAMIVLLSTSCATMNAVRALPKGESALTLSAGGPLARMLIMDGPVPYAVLRYNYGLTDRLGISASSHLLLLAMNQIGLQADVSYQLFTQQGWRPECGVGGGLLFLSALNSDSRLHPTVTASASWLFKDRFLTYCGAQGLFQLAPNRDPETPVFVWTPVLGEQIRLGRHFSVTLEAKWYEPLVPTAPRTVQYLLPIAGHGAVGFVLGVGYDFGGRGR